MNVRTFVRALAGIGVTCALALAHPAGAQSLLTGRVLDASTGMPLAGASVRMEGARIGAITAADGSFSIRSPETTGIALSGNAVVSLIGYRSELAVLDASQPVTIRLTPVAIPIEGAEVNSQLAREGRSPTAFTALDRQDIQRDYFGQDLPMLLAETPGAYAYSDAGNGIGYSYLKIRGFPSRRIGVTINGIPLNDPESREVYWIDHPDLAASAQEIQVQRGVGASAYGTTSLGGSVNVETIPFSQDRYLTLDAGAGSFDTQRYSAQAGSGLLGDKYAVSTRLSRIKTDGYREASWSDLWSYFVGIARVDSKVVTRLNLYGGPEETHLAYLGVPKAYLDGAITGDADLDRRFNPITFRNERDHFFEPHYELLQDWKSSEKLSLSSALFYFPGKGFYDEFRQGVDLRAYNYPDDPSTPASTDIVRRRWVKNVHLGWVPRARVTSGRYEGEAGLDLRFHEGRHWGELLWSKDQAANPEPNHVYYDYKGRAINTSAFTRQSWAFTPRVRATADLSLHRQRYELRDDRLAGLFFTQDYTFFTPRAGVIVTLREREDAGLRHVEAYASFSRANAEPIFRELYDPENAGSLPGFSTVLPSGELRDPLVKPERVYDWDAGLRARGTWGAASLGGYWMDFRNEIVYNGSLDDNGNPITGNAARSRHAGIEGSLAAHAGRALEFRGAFQWSLDRFRDYHEFVDSTTTIDYTGNRIAGFPGVSGRLAAAYRVGHARLEFAIEHAGRQFLDNTEDERLDPAARTAPGYVPKTIAPWTVANAAFALRTPNFLGSEDTEWTVRVSNLFDRKYETAGYVDFPAPTYAPTPVWIPAATRSVFVGLRASL
jgi:iron complex outermembrane receptor protein